MEGATIFIGNCEGKREAGGGQVSLGIAVSVRPGKEANTAIPGAVLFFFFRDPLFSLSSSKTVFSLTQIANPVGKKKEKNFFQTNCTILM